jgi:hypothetical protein
MKRTNGAKIYEYYNYVVKETVPLLSVICIEAGYEGRIVSVKSACEHVNREKGNIP